MRPQTSFRRAGYRIDSSSVIIRKRVYLVLLVMAGLFLILLGRLVWVQIVKAPHLRELALEQRMRPVPVDPKRGTIYDRCMRELAVSISADSVYAIPAEVREPARTAKQLAPVLGMSENELLSKLTTRQQTVWLKRKVDHEAAQKIRRLSLPGIAVAESGQRFYPKDTLAAQVIGIAGIDNQGLEGLEQYYDSELKGVRGQIVAERDAAGREIPEGRHSYVAPTDGRSLVLTIDEVIQYICERELEMAMAETGSARGLVLAMEPKTGEILAMAMRPTFNPNSYGDYLDSRRRNFTVCDMLEPGSTFKVVTAAAALEEGIVTASTPFFDPGYVKVEDRTIRCHKAGGHGSQTFIEALENSCNPVFATLSLKLGVEKFVQYARGFGLVDKTGIDYPGEATGMMHQMSKIGPVELATYGFGQGLTVTPLQLLNALCVIANGGALMKPMLVRKIVDEAGNPVREYVPTKVRQVVSANTASELSRMLQSVIVNGSGQLGAVPGYAVAGKTGTAQKPEHGRYGEKRVASFMGYGPANDPRIAVLVILDEPQTQVKYGGVIAAPVFRAVMQDVFRYMELPPAYAVGTPQGSAGSSRIVTVPEVTGKSRAEAEAELKGAGLLARYEGDGDIVTNQVPKAGSQVAEGTAVIVYFGHEELYNLDGTEAQVPDVIGKTLKEAALILGARGLGVDPSGRGLVVRQSPAPGTHVKKGTAVTIYLED